jgi:hypothetical protein
MEHRLILEREEYGVVGVLRDVDEKDDVNVGMVGG